MSVRRLLTGVASVSLAVATLTMVAPAQADPSFVPDADDIVGVGSDTSMNVLTYLADGHSGVAGYNAGGAAQRLVSFDAWILDANKVQTNSAFVTLRAGTPEVKRPNGSGGGKRLLYGAENNPNVNFARSSSSLSTAEQSAGLQAFPFAKDTLAVATANTTNAPATLTPKQIVGIYEGTYKDWSQLGGTAGAIIPLAPQTDSGTGDFFKKELDKIKGSPVTYSGVTFVQEHDDSQIKANPNAIAPFSVGRAGLLGTVKIMGGWQVGRALYNVTRQADAASPWATAIFGPSGFICSPAAASLILDAGFEQLLNQSQGGKCGVPVSTSLPEAELLTAKVTTTTTVAGTSPAVGALNLSSTVAGGGQVKPQGAVEFFVDGVSKGSSLVTGGTATKNLTGIPAGARTVVAKFTPTGAAFSASESAPATVTVLAASTTPPVPAPVAKAKTTLKAKFKKSYAKAKSYKGKITVTESAPATPSGKIVVKLGKKTVGKGTVTKGVAVVKLKKLKKGKNKLVATYAGDTAFLGSTVKFTVTVK